MAFLASPAPPPAHSFTFFSSFLSLFLFRPRGEREGTNRFHQLRRRIEPRHNYLVLAMVLKRCCRLYPLKDILLFARAQVGERTAALDRKCNVERIRFRRREGAQLHFCEMYVTSLLDPLHTRARAEGRQSSAMLEYAFRILQ